MKCILQFSRPHSLYYKGWFIIENHNLLKTKELKWSSIPKFRMSQFSANCLLWIPTSHPCRPSTNLATFRAQLLIWIAKMLLDTQLTFMVATLLYAVEPKEKLALSTNALTLRASKLIKQQSKNSILGGTARLWWDFLCALHLIKASSSTSTSSFISFLCSQWYKISAYLTLFGLNYRLIYYAQIVTASKYVKIMMQNCEQMSLRYLCLFISSVSHILVAHFPRF